MLRHFTIAALAAVVFGSASLMTAARAESDLLGPKSQNGQCAVMTDSEKGHGYWTQCPQPEVKKSRSRSKNTN